VTRRIPALAVAATAVTSLAVPASAETLRPTQSRPHSAVVIRDSYNVATDRLSANVRPDHGRLRVRIDFSARSTSGKRVVVLRAGRCVRGPLSSPSCPPAFSHRVVLYPAKTVHITANALLRRPHKRQDAIRISVTIPGQVSGNARPIAELFLRGSAWRKLAGTDFGYAIHARPGVTISSVRAYGAGVSSGRLRGTFKWEARSGSDLAAKTVISPCFEGAPTCPVSETPVTLAAGQDAAFFQRPTLTRGSASIYTFSLVATDTNLPLLVTRLPWPG
jgi:hypothetical protein